MSSIRLRRPAMDASVRWTAAPRSQAARRRRAWTIAVSVLLHAALLAALLAIPKREDGEGAAPPAYQLMFDSGAPQQPPATPGVPPESPAPTPQQPPIEAATPPAPAPPQDAPPGPQSTPTEPPQADAMPLPPAPAAEAPPQPTAPPAVSQPEAQPAPAPPTEAPPLALPPSEAIVTPEPAPLPPPAQPRPEPQPARPPDVRLETPEAPRPQPVPEAIMPVPPPPLPPLPRAVPRAAQRPQAAPPPGTFGNPMDLSFNAPPSRAAAPRSTAPRGSVASRSLDLSPGAPKGPNRSEMFFDARAAKLGADWKDGLMGYWLNHRYYPRQAAENAEDGSVDIELTVDGSGKVRNAVLKSRSGSTFIDMAAVGTWRNAQLRPLPPELGDSYTFTITLNYILIR